MIKAIAWGVVGFSLFSCAPAGSDGDTTKASDTSKDSQGVVVAWFETNILDKSPQRVHNIHLAANALESVLVGPGEEFSFNGTVGERTAERGYKEAAVIEDNHKEYEHGGGVCQVSSTIYNAVKQAGLEVVERHQHQKPVYYVELGNDAAVDYGNLDFRFRNNTEKVVEVAISYDKDVTIRCELRTLQ